MANTKKDGSNYKDVRIQFFVTRDMDQDLKEVSCILGLGKNELIRSLIRTAIDNVKQKA